MIHSPFPGIDMVIWSSHTGRRGVALTDASSAAQHERKEMRKTVTLQMQRRDSSIPQFARGSGLVVEGTPDPRIKGNADQDAQRGRW